MADTHFTVRVMEGGRVVIPAHVRRALGVAAGDTLVGEVRDGELHLLTRRQGIARAQALVAQYLQGSGSMADELIAERRAEAAAESNG